MMQEISLLQAHMIAFAAGFLMDLVIGDPHNIPHPVKWIGNLIAFLDRRLLGEGPDTEPDPAKRNGSRERLNGLILVLTVILITSVMTFAAVYLSYHFSVWLGIVIEAVLTCYILAMTSLRKESMNVYKELVKGNLEGSRRAVSMIVGRDTAVLDEKGVTKAAVETVAENFSDGVIAPMLYDALGGPVLGLAYKAVNTMDSMIGYRNDRYQWFGTAAARLDDAVNYIPSRISALLLIAACIFAGRDYDAAAALRIWKRDRRNHKSPNAAQTESACAGALGLQLAGDASYFGKIVHKPTIGDDTRPVEAYDIVRVNRLMLKASLLGEIICLLAIFMMNTIK
jgi:adenosylcobinamide-phosphate synthase